MTFNYNIPYVIAEAGCNHKGDMKIALELIQTAARCKVNAIKFQKRCNRELLSPEQYDAPHPNLANSYGETYGKHREYLEFTLEQHAKLKAWCEECGIVYSTSVWDLTSAKEIATLNPVFIKIPSASNTNYDMLDWLCKHYKGEIQISVGMTSRVEEREIIDIFVQNKRNEDLTIFSCTSGYPVPNRSVCLVEITRLQASYGGLVRSIGFSGHHLGTAIDIAAFTLGASVIERHYTLNRSWKGTDHSASLEPQDLYRLIEDLHAVYEALGEKEDEILPIEQVQRDKLKYRKL